MKKRLGILGGIALVALLTLTFAGTALAHPPTPNATPRGYGYGVGLLDRVTLQRVADLLGITADEVADQRREGKALAEIAQAQGVAEEALTDTILAPFKDWLTLQVKYGYLTQEQADARLRFQEARVKELISTTPGPFRGRGYGRGYGWGHGWGGFGGMMGGFGGWRMMGRW